MHKYAGVTLDWYDDKGATLREKFPTADQLPDIIKAANILPKEKLANEQFALIAIDGGDVLRKFACYDPGTTAMSVIYLMEHGDKLPDGAVKMAASNLFNACVEHDILPPEVLTKLAQKIKTAFGGRGLYWVDRALLGAGTGGLGGALGGAATAPEGRRAHGALEGMGTGAITGALTGAIAPYATARMTALGSGMAGAASGMGLSKAKERTERRSKATSEESAKKRKHKRLREDYFAETKTGSVLGRAMTSPWAPALTASGLGAAGGALTADEDKLMAALKGGGYGLVAGAAGRALPSLASMRSVPGSAAGTALGGLLGGALAGEIQNEDLQRYREHDERIARSRARAEEQRQKEREAMGLKTAEPIDITGQTPKQKVAARPSVPEHYAVTSQGRRLYPIDSWDNVKLASDYWLEEKVRMEPEMRREFAVKLARRAKDLGYPLSEEIKEAGARTYAPSGHLAASLEMRKVACTDAEASQFLDELFEKRAQIEPDVYAEVLRRFDVEQGLHGIWDQAILDPWASTFAKEASAVVWESGADRVTEAELVNLARNQGGGLSSKFTDEFIGEFEKDPVGMFNSMPEPQKKILARLANDEAAQGGSVMDSENVGYKSPRMSAQAK